MFCLKCDKEVLGVEPECPDCEHTLIIKKTDTAGEVEAVNEEDEEQ